MKNMNNGNKKKLKNNQILIPSQKIMQARDD